MTRYHDWHCGAPFLPDATDGFFFLSLWCASHLSDCRLRSLTSFAASLADLLFLIVIRWLKDMWRSYFRTNSLPKIAITKI
jgi:hypothetical protein